MIWQTFSCWIELIYLKRLPLFYTISSNANRVSSFQFREHEPRKIFSLFRFCLVLIWKVIKFHYLSTQMKHIKFWSHCYIILCIINRYIFILSFIIPFLKVKVSLGVMERKKTTNNFCWCPSFKSYDKEKVVWVRGIFRTLSNI